MINISFNDLILNSLIRKALKEGPCELSIHIAYRVEKMIAEIIANALSSIHWDAIDPENIKTKIDESKIEEELSSIFDIYSKKIKDRFRIRMDECECGCGYVYSRIEKDSEGDLFRDLSFNDKLLAITTYPELLDM